MNKKSGFTLAEVLITLGIVGVVSALVLPTFTTRMQTAKVGPRLAKAIAAFEQANKTFLNEQQADSIYQAEIEFNGALHYIDDDGIDYFKEVLPKYMKGSFSNANDEPGFYAADGILYCFVAARARQRKVTDTKCVYDQFSDGTANHELPHLAPVAGSMSTAFMIDIDGNGGPGQPGRDQFFFQMMEDGSLRPWGGSWENDRFKWNAAQNCPKSSTGAVGNYALCAGHVMENGLKVEYK